jgi:AraC-like DNA-binding protein
LEQIAAAINYSPRHTARLIKNTYGASLSEIRRSRKNK